MSLNSLKLTFWIWTNNINSFIFTIAPLFIIIYNRFCIVYLFYLRKELKDPDQLYSTLKTILQHVKVKGQQTCTLKEPLTCIHTCDQQDWPLCCRVTRTPGLSWSLWRKQRHLATTKWFASQWVCVHMSEAAKVKWDPSRSGLIVNDEREIDIGKKKNWVNLFFSPNRPQDNERAPEEQVLHDTQAVHGRHAAHLHQLSWI